MSDDMKIVLMVFGGPILFALTVLLLDWIGRRRDDRARQQQN
jgi:hypothetical protein